MSLILTATCKDGIVICSDKRCTLKTGILTSFTDDLYKLYHFNKNHLLAFNHGINRVNERAWIDYLSEFETTYMQKNMEFNTIVNKFISFFSRSAAQELSTNLFDDSIGFVFCAPAHTPQSQAIIRELFWKKNFPIEDKLHQGLIRTGIGARYLNQYMSSNPEINTIEYWKSITVEDGLLEIINLFKIACAERKIRGGNEFSDTYDTKILK